MTATTYEEARQAVQAILSDVTRMRIERITDDALLIDDLHVTGDDFTFVVVPWLQKNLGIHRTGPEHRHVRTVRDLIELYMNPTPNMPA